MAEVWSLPDLDELTCTGPDWLLHLLNEKAELERTMILMTMWRIWHARNEMVHNKPMPSIESSKRFLCSYLESLLLIKQHPEADPAKGKAVVSINQVQKMKWKEKAKAESLQPKPWCKPPGGRVKLNVDGSYLPNVGEEVSGLGMIIRDENGSIIASACRSLSSCSSPLHAELEACCEGIALVLEWSDLSCIIETDCMEALTMIQAPGIDRSPLMGLVQKIKELTSVGDSYEIDSVRREQNKASHLLASFGRAFR